MFGGERKKILQIVINRNENDWFGGPAQLDPLLVYIYRLGLNQHGYRLDVEGDC